MRMCTECELPLVERLNDNGRHKDACPRKPDREAYLAEKRRTLPRLVRLQEFMKTHPHPTADEHRRLLEEDE